MPMRSGDSTVIFSNNMTKHLIPVTRWWSVTLDTAFAQIAMVAHNILRWVALVERPDKPHFSKKIRRRFVYIPGKIIQHARQTFLKIPARFYEALRAGARKGVSPVG